MTLRASVYLTISVSLFLLIGLPRAIADEKGKNTTTDEDGEWTPLFDGKTTDGWTPRDEADVFQAVDGELHLLAKNKNIWVTTTHDLSDFVFEAEVKMPDDAATSGFNSGLAFRCTGATGKPKGYQCEVDARPDGPNGGVYGIGLGGWLYPTKETAAEHRKRLTAAFQPGEWNHYRIECKGPRIITYINGQLIADVESSESLSGYLAIQHHGKGGTVRFRNLRVQKN